jgi:isocitrate/isopropylmalate dehydrogenase
MLTRFARMFRQQRTENPPPPNVALRKALDLFANVRPVHSLPGIKTRFMDVKIEGVIFAANLAGGLQSGAPPYELRTAT